MTVNKYSLAFLIKPHKSLADDQYFWNIRTCEVLPEEVEVCYACIIENVSVVGEPDFIVNTISTDRMFTWFLQIEDASYVQTRMGLVADQYLLKHLLNNVKL